MKKVRLDLFDSSINFDRNATKLKFIFWYLLKTFFFLSAIPYPSSFKAFILRCFGAKVGVGLVLKPRVNIHFPWKLEVGNNVWIGEEVCILNFENIVIGSNVCISQRAFLCGGNHNYNFPTMPYRNGSIFLNDGCWIGASSFLGPNITIGVNTVVSAYSFVSKSLEGNSIYSGNPAIFIKSRW
jgi:putative colanic acid biosynthesis acetyltransferase WcaF